MQFDRGAHLQDLASPVHGEALLGGVASDVRCRGRRGCSLVGSAAPVKGGDRVLVLAAHTQPLALGCVCGGGESAHARSPRGELRVELGEVAPGSSSSPP